MSDILEIMEQVSRRKESLSPDDVFAKYAHLRISESTPIEAPEAIVTAYDDISICTPGNITTISGQSKGGKSAIVSVLLADCIKTSNGFDGSDNLRVSENTNRKAVIHVDTEQSPYHQYRNFKYGILNRARIEREPEYYHSYNIRPLNLSEYKPFIEHIFEAAKAKHGGIHLAVIDGVADFIGSVNDEEESNSIVAFFMNLAVKYDTAIILVLHLNPGSDKERGHLGSQLQRKSESLLTIKKEGDISILEAKFQRSGGQSDFPPLRYQYNKQKGYHTFFESTNTTDSMPEKLREIAKFVFTKSICAGDAINLIMESERVEKRKANTLLTAIYNAGLVEKEPVGKNVFYNLKNEEETPF